MLFTNIKRIIRAGFINFWRNGFVSLASVLIMGVTLFVIGSIFFNSVLLDASLKELRDKVDINVYFVNTASEEEILALKDMLGGFPEVKFVEYISRERALENFKERHKDDALTLQALEELDENPLRAVLNVKTKEPSQYESIAAFLKDKPVLSGSGAPIIDSVNYLENKTAIDRLDQIISSSEASNIAKTVILVFVSVIVVFNTIRLAIYVSREEISVMRLVGASNKYVRGPFVIVGILSGVIGGLITIIAFYPLTYWFGPLFYPLPLFLTDSVGNLTLFDYYVDNFGQIFFLIVGSGVVLGAISSWLAVRRYLKI
ncbi:MAG: permease-like cell division protein FtsX [bacterium]|nr:permease-like cell division protein FtsX [bacterium]